MTIHSNILAWRIPWTEEPGRLQSMESQRVRSNFHFSSLQAESTVIRIHIFFCHGYSFYTSTVLICLAFFDCLYLKVKHWTGCLGVLHQWRGLKTGHILPEALRQEWNRKSIKYSFFFFFFLETPHHWFEVDGKSFPCRCSRADCLYTELSRKIVQVFLKHHVEKSQTNFLANPTLVSDVS